MAPDRRGFRSPGRGLTALVLSLALVLLTLYGVRCVRRGAYAPPDPSSPTSEHRKRQDRGSDFTAYYSAGELARRGESLYDYELSSTPFRPFIYPPMFAIFPMLPLSCLGHNAALAVYYLLNVILLFAALWMLRGLLWGAPAPGGPPGPFWRRPEVGLFLALLACGRFLDSNFSSGNANVVILFLLTTGLYALQRNHGLGGGLAVALATAFKLTPGLFGLYFLWTRRGWAMLGGALGLALFLYLVPSLVLGFARNEQLLNGYWEYVKPQLGIPAGLFTTDSQPAKTPVIVGWKPAVQPQRGDTGEVKAEEEAVSETSPPRAFGISLRGTLQKLLSKSVAMNHREPGASQRINVANLEPQTARRLADGLGLILLLLCVALTLPFAARSGTFGPALSWSLVVTTMLLISPLTRKAHLVVLVLPAAVLIALLQQNHFSMSASEKERTGGRTEALSSWTRRVAWSALLAVGGIGLLTSPDVVGRQASEWLHAAGCFTGALLALYAALALALWRPAHLSAINFPTPP